MVQDRLSLALSHPEQSHNLCASSIKAHLSVELMKEGVVVQIYLLCSFFCRCLVDLFVISLDTWEVKDTIYHPCKQQKGHGQQFDARIRDSPIRQFWPVSNLGFCKVLNLEAQK